MIELSVIIPTHQRADTLRMCLEHLEKQTAVDRIEVIVVSDGHDEATDRLFAERQFDFPVTYFSIPKSQQGAARNRGAEKAQGNICLFIGDDAFLEPDACEKHLDAHARGEKAVLGFATWDENLEVTPVMRWLEKSGWQFGYPKIMRYANRHIPNHMQHLFTYTINISVSKSVAAAIPFDEEVTLYGWEDILWGMRLAQQSVPLCFEPDARARHHHSMTLEQSLARMRTLGESVVKITATHPDLDRMPRGIKMLAYRLASLLPTMSGRHRKAFVQGIEQAQKDEKEDVA